MSWIRRSRHFVLVSSVWLVCWTHAAAGEPYLAFASGLRQRGYGDMAVAYLQQVAQRADTPPPIREVLDLELSISYQVWSQQSSNSELAEQWKLESQRLYQQFVAAHPRHPAIPKALLELGDAAFDRGQRILMRASVLADSGLRTKTQEDARAALNDARTQLEQSADQFKQLLTVLSVETALPPEPGAVRPSANDPQKVVREIEVGLVESKLKLAGVHYYLSQTYPDSKGPERTAALKNALKEFEWVFRRCRNSEVGIRAQLWQARVTAELGDLPAAIDLYDEVLANEPDATGTPAELAAVFGQAALLRLRLVAELNGDETARNESAEWLRAHPKWKETAPFQGITLECAKALLRRAKNETPKLKEKLTKDAVALLAAVAAVPGEYQKDAIQLQREKLDLKSDVPVGSSVDPRAVGDAAAAAGQWIEAVAAYETAVEQAKQGADPESLAAARHRLNFGRYHLSVSQYSAGKMEEAIQTAGLVAKSGANEPHAAEAASLTCFAALSLCETGGLDIRTPAYSRLQRVTEFTLKTWPGQPAADDAHIVLGQFEAKRSEWERAIEHFDRVEAASPRFLSAVLGAARAYWRLYLSEKAKPDPSRDNNLVNQWRAKAESKLRGAVVPSGNSETLSSSPLQLFECRVLLAEILLESNQFPEVIEITRPLIAQLSISGQSSERESLAVRAHVVGLRALTGVRDLQQASDLAQAIADRGPDTPYVNAALLEFTREARQDFVKSRSAVERVRGTLEQAVVSGTQDQTLKLKEPLQKVASSLAKRRQLTLQSLAFVANTCGDLGMHPIAREACERILQLAATDPQIAEKTPNLVANVRLQLVNELYDQGQFEEALRQIEQLVSTHPGSLDLLMKKGEVLQAWAGKDATHLADCASHWTQVRVLASRARPRPKEYFQIVYNAAYCLIEQSNHTRDLSHARQAEQLLKSTLALHPALDGPEMVERYNSLLARTALPKDARK